MWVLRHETLTRGMLKLVSRTSCKHKALRELSLNSFCFFLYFLLDEKVYKESRTSNAIRHAVVAIALRGNARCSRSIRVLELLVVI